MVGQAIYMLNLADQESVYWKFTTPEGNTDTFVTATYNKASDCFVVSPGGAAYCGYHDNLLLAAYASLNSCNQPFSLVETGSWSISTYDGNTLLYTNQIQITRNPSSMLGITTPTFNQLFQLLQGNYNSTGALSFSAGTSTGKPINWNVALHYQSSGGYPNPATDPTPLTFQGTSYSYSGYQSIGGQVNVSASTTAPDGTAVNDCVTFYVEGPETGIPNSAITGRLDQLYTSSASYTQYLNDGTSTPNLMTGVAETESTYRQFDAPPTNNPDLYGLYNDYQIAAKWPLESPTNPSGQCIGLLQVPTTDPNAWDWTTNTLAGVNLFIGGSSDKVQSAVRYETDIIQGYSSKKVTLPAHINGDGSYLQSLNGFDRENNALVLYGGWVAQSCPSLTLSCTLNSLYYIPQCAPPGVQITVSVRASTSFLAADRVLNSEHG